MPTWPNSMPKPVLQQLRIGAPQNAVIRTQMDQGPAMQRQRFTAAPRPVNMTFPPVTKTVLNTFETFYESDLGYGALAFDMTHPISGVTGSFRFVQNGDPYTITPAARNGFRISVALELLP